MSLFNKISFLILWLGFSSLGYSQCTNLWSFGSAAAPTGTTTTTISFCTYQEEYNTLTSVVAGNTYQSDYDLGGCITVHSGTPGGPVVAFGSAPLTWTATVSGTYYIHYTLDCVFCITNTSCGTSTISCVSCGGGGGCSVVAPVPNDACYQQVVTNDTYCCDTDWDALCQSDYDACYYSTNCVAAPVPYDACYQQVINNDSYCCDTDWDIICQGDYDACSGGGTGCSGQTTNDFCNDAAILTQGSGTWSSTTSSTFTADLPGNISSEFCGSIENNSWYMFTALSTTETFPITSVFNCTSGWGIQAEVYEVTYDVNGCCTGFTSMSNCYNPASTTTGTVTATGLTVGQTYMLMVDGNAGDDCDFTVSNWTATGILPVELVELKGVAMPTRNFISWTTKSELNSDYFTVEKSYNGIDFNPIGKVDGAGNSSSILYYSFEDEDIRIGKVYYRLNQVDIDGKSELTEVIVLDREADEYGIVGIKPNPVVDVLFVELNPLVGANNGLLEIVDARGTTIYRDEINYDQYKLLEIDLKHIEAGVYMIKYTDKLGRVQMERFVKK
ncbi:T9SS type A sorting domain-containing protein [Paracrocinitomix mangrovi]|uniref:T9SS type A sorting domain-containing protein n=1 Tax=Paracrocinitomix mangrovi TaxID=2862509 RepID=UPI001C8D462B|nr:T9SS type A sorting domain-containing protein [Paracrocinitomix mangrovi]UKN03299.1 T9SS type A sorting domain-containing protein [Paracrocinitomix mangrovi]